MEMTARELKDPSCFTPDGMHIFEDSDGPFYAQCSVCQERYLVISETMCRQVGILSVETEEGLINKGE